MIMPEGISNLPEGSRVNSLRNISFEMKILDEKSHWKSTLYKTTVYKQSYAIIISKYKKNINTMVVKCVSFLDEDQINIIPETCSKPTVNKGRTI